MFEGPQPWAKIVTYFIEKEGKKHMWTKIGSYGSHWDSGIKLNVWAGD